MIDMTTALAAEKTINDTECEAALTAIGRLTDANDRDRLLREITPAFTARSKATRDLIRSLFPPVENVERYDDFHTLDAWNVYGGFGFGNSAWGQNQGRTGFYGMTGLTQPNSGGVRMEVTPSSRVAANGKPGYNTQFLASKKPIPLYCRIEVEAEHDLFPGFWPSALWLTAYPGGSEDAEADAHEWFGNDPGRVRQATHLRNSLTNKRTNNASWKPGNHAHWFPVKAGIRRYAVTTEPDGPGEIRFTYEIDSKVTYTFSTAELTAMGQPHNAWLKGTTGWNVRICTQTEGDSGSWGAVKGGTMRVYWLKVTQP